MNHSMGQRARKTIRERCELLRDGNKRADMAVRL